MENNNVNMEEQGGLNLTDLLYLCLSKWYWFVISVALCVGAAVLYVLRTEPEYTRMASIAIQDNSKGQSTADISDFSELGMFSMKSNIYNEVGALKSPDLMMDVCKALNLDMNYKTDGRFHKVTLYGTTLPINVKFTQLGSSESASCTVAMKSGGLVELSEFEYGENEYSDCVSGMMGDTIQTPAGSVIVTPAKNYYFEDGKKIYVSKRSLEAARRSYSAKVNVALADKQSTIIQISCNDVNVQRAADVITTLIGAYNHNWVQNKNQISLSTSIFISERLKVIEDELGTVDNDISSFKSENLLPDVQSVASMYMAQANEADAGISDLNNQVYMARYIRNHLTNDDNKYQLIPVNSGISNINLSAQITEYNKMMQERNSLLVHSSENNPLVKDMDASLDASRQALVASVDNQLIALDAQIKSLQGFSKQATSQIKSNPTQAKYLLSVERQQKVKEALYLYLLQKREENELSQAFTAYNTKIISMPNGNPGPTAPAKSKCLLLAFVLGLAIPAGIIYMMEAMNTVVRGRKDLESMSVPFVGEIPQTGDRYKLRPRKKNGSVEVKAVVKEFDRDVINEAFRVVRTNLEFITGTHAEGGAEIISITSALAGSGKTFITFNLATSLAIKHKKVLVMDLDLRKGTMRKYVGRPKSGISNYLAGKAESYKDLIVRNAGTEGLDVLPAGVIPPNPTELLFTPNFESMIQALRAEYDYIFMDCPPVEIVADASIINRYTDHTIFIVRAGLLDRSMLPVIEKYYTDGKLKNMSILLNGTESAGGYGKYGKYGYRYGYKYGYNYGYGK